MTTIYSYVYLSTVLIMNYQQLQGSNGWPLIEFEKILFYSVDRQYAKM